MQLLVFILAYPILWLISKLPHTLFYFFSDVIFVFMYYVVGYRKKVVYDNLKLAFPEKDGAELKVIRKKFYHHLCDVFLEMIKTMDLSKDDIKAKYQITNMELAQETEKEKSILVALTHYANWEWTTSVNNYIKANGYAIYQKIGNKYFDRLVQRIRARWNTYPITQQDTVKTLIRNEQKGIKGVYGIVSDQSPMVSKAKYWSNFMGIKVPIFNGTEALAKKLDLPVFFMKVSKIKRGYYRATFIPITMAGASTSKNEITEAIIKETEKQIRECPEHYLWTHKRWKHRNKVPEAFK
ncbi:lysophospholipid acyltransferase family protein [Spongiimicrobium salis]|uniref:lysophospholipid acyltransferase family protein n=1 Tax=Spongiimicrobium salis TaxID=1667022 RepID=UPI00374DC893